MVASSQYVYRQRENPNGKMGEVLARVVLANLGSLDGRGRICELGCGNGYLSGLMAAAGFEVLGLDASESGIRIASEHHGARARFICRSIRPDLAQELGQDSFDAVISSEVIEHLYKPMELPELAFRILKPGGRFLVTTPYHGYLKNLLIAGLGRCDAHMNPLWDGGHIKFFSERTLSALVVRCGFLDLRFSFSGRVPLLWKSMVCTASKP